jgi:DNA (cytosine-5)-methyltransferase 1
MVRIFDLFAGVGGFRLASNRVFKKSKIISKYIGWSEIDKYCQKTYKANFRTENEFFIDDIKKITAYKNSDCNLKNFNNKKRSFFIKKNIPKFDCLFAGFPCQSFSKMGNQKSLKDERGALFFDIAAILFAVKPKYFLLENVNRILTIDNKATIKIIFNTLENIGYKVDLFKVNSEDYGVPQTRRRIFIYGCLNKLNLNIGLKNPKKVKNKITTKDILSKSVDSKYILSKKILKTILSHGTGGYYQKSEIDLAIARPLTKTMAKMHRAHQDNYYSNCYILGEKNQKWVRRLTPVEAFKLQGFSENFVNKAYNVNVSDTQLYMQAGNAVTVKVVESILKVLIENKWFLK